MSEQKPLVGRTVEEVNTEPKVATVVEQVADQEQPTISEQVEAVEAAEEEAAQEQEQPKTLTAFLKANLVTGELKDLTYKLEGRLAEAPPFQCKSLSKKSFDNIKKRATKKGKLNLDSLSAQILVDCCVEPNFSDINLIKDVGALTPEAAVYKVLEYGEVDVLAAQIMEDSGLTVNVTKLENEVKNS